MIELTRLNSSSLVVNSDLIQYVESTPDTTLTLVNGEKVVVRESAAEVIALTIRYRARVIAEAAKQCPGGILPASGAALPTLSVQAVQRVGDDIARDTSAIARRRRAEG
jgi:flagellar protein FlbD